MPSISGDQLSFYAATAGMEAAFTLAFILPGFTPSNAPLPGSSSATAVAPAVLVPLSESSLALVGTLLVTMLSTPSAPTLTVLNPAPSASVETVNGTQAEVNTAFLSVEPSLGQGYVARLSTGESGEEAGLATGPEAETPVNQGAGTTSPPWSRYVLGLDEGFAQIRQENPDAPPGNAEPGASPGPSQDEATEPPGPQLPDDPAVGPVTPAGDRNRVERSPRGDRAVARVFAVAIGTFCADQAARASWGGPVVLAAALIVRASPVVELLVDERRRGASHWRPDDGLWATASP
jgi:hypothetical protein